MRQFDIFKQPTHRPRRSIIVRPGWPMLVGITLLACAWPFMGHVLAVELEEMPAAPQPLSSRSDATTEPPNTTESPSNTTDSPPNTTTKAPALEDRPTPARKNLGPLAEDPINVDTPEELLDTLGITRESFAGLPEGENLEDDPASLKLLRSVLYRLPRMSLAWIDRWASADANLSEWGADTLWHRRGFFKLSGRIHRLEVIDHSEQEYTLWQFKKYYRCHVRLGESEVPAVVYVREIPRSWKPGPLDEGIRFTGMFFVRGRAEQEGEPGPLVFVARRIAWQPDTLLGNAGMDYGLFDGAHSGRKLDHSDRECFYQMLNAVGGIKQEVLEEEARKRVATRHVELTRNLTDLQQRRDESSKALSASSANSSEYNKLREQLAKIERELIITEAALVRTRKGFSDFISIIESPSDYTGRLIKLKGTAKSIVRMPLGGEDQDVVRRFGFDHYYEIHALVTPDLDIQQQLPRKKKRKTAQAEDKKRIKEASRESEEAAGDVVVEVSGSDDLAVDDSDSGDIESTDSEAQEEDDEEYGEPATEMVSLYPVTFCVRTLPPGMKTGPNVNEPIQIVGFYMKSWKYYVPDRTGEGPSYRTAPLLIGRMPLAVEPSVISNPTYSLIAGLMFVAALGIVALSVWLLGRSDRAFEDATIGKRFALAEGVSLDNLDVPQEEDVDLSHLADLEVDEPPA